MSAEPISETGTQSRPRLAVVHTPTATVSTLGFVAIIADASGFHGLITRVDMLNHLRRSLP